jgi:hypothetical protein
MLFILIPAYVVEKEARVSHPELPQLLTNSYLKAYR